MVRGIFLLMFLVINVTAHAGVHVEGDGLTGQKAPEFDGLMWINSEPVSMKDLRGKVVLIRFWLTGCPYCRNTAPSLVEFHNRYSEKGLVVIGIHHPKSERTRDPELAARQAELFGFEFPVAHDPEWKTINKFWLRGNNRKYSSSSILIDREGVIRYVHEGGEYYRTDADSDADEAFNTIDKRIRHLLGE